MKIPDSEPHTAHRRSLSSPLLNWALPVPERWTRDISLRAGAWDVDTRPRLYQSGVGEPGLDTAGWEDGRGRWICHIFPAGGVAETEGLGARLSADVAADAVGRHVSFSSDLYHFFGCVGMGSNRGVGDLDRGVARSMEGV
ncbi:hypothetical protein V500_04249 [Pseudogymnoascus sp. VKM F-4518 (FW-2643)]|nr:hypothetical protein V500_04249 [Pseudogymnoascus sp. VKM F-4518 (FW-2643)]